MSKRISFDPKILFIALEIEPPMVAAVGDASFVRQKLRDEVYVVDVVGDSGVDVGEMINRERARRGALNGERTDRRRCQ
jgi:hypothetical protein